MLIKDLVKTQIVIGDDTHSESRSMKYVYFDKSLNRYDVRIPKADVRVVFAPNRLEEALDFRDFVLKAMSDETFDISKIPTPSNEYRGIRGRTVEKVTIEIPERFTISNDVTIVDSESEFSVTLSTPELAQHYVEKYNQMNENRRKMKADLSISDLMLPTLFEQGRFNQLSEIELLAVASHLRLVSKLHGDLKAPRNESGERYVVYDNSVTSSGWRVHIKLGNRVLQDKNFGILREAIEYRNRIIRPLIQQLESEMMLMIDKLNRK